MAMPTAAAYPVTRTGLRVGRTRTRVTVWAITVGPAMACVVSVQRPAPRRIAQVYRRVPSFALMGHAMRTRLAECSANAIPVSGAMPPVANCTTRVAPSGTMPLVTTAPPC